MFAERLIIETDAKGKPTCLPDLPPNSKMEAIFLLLEDLEQLPFSVRTTEEMNADIQAERDAWD